MSDENKPFEGIMVGGLCNGVSNYLDKNGVVHYSLLVIPPASQGVLEVSLPSEPKANQYPVGAKISIRTTPRFWQGRLSGLILAQ